MILNASILFLTAFLGGISVFFFPNLQKKRLDLLLNFAGSYLFSITIIHILPEVYIQYPEPFRIGIFILLGFFLQMVLGSLSTGLEHGHLHIKHHSNGITPSVLLIGLGIHAFMEGTILYNPSSITVHDHSGGILLGIVLHKIPAAMALVTVIYSFTGLKKLTIWFLIIFSLSSPLGLILASLIGDYNIFSSTDLVLLYAVVCGSFLHISTTIFFESNPQHKLKYGRLAFIFLGAVVAVLIEMFL